MQAIAIYGTGKEVKLLDRRLGILHLLILTVVVAYVIGIRVVIEKGYQSLELSQGTIAVTLDGGTYTTANGLVAAVDEADLVRPVKEGAALFLATVKTTTVLQTLSNCTDPSYKCRSDSDCAHDPPLSYGQCEGDGYCMREMWCPAAGSTEANDKTQISELQALDRLAITLIGTINFPHLAPDTLSTEDGRNSKVTWSLPEVLKRGQIDTVEAVASGAVLSLVLKWSCTLGITGGFSTKCLPHLRVYDISPQAGRFWVQWADYYQQETPAGQNAVYPTQPTGKLYRDLHNATGIRMLISSRGNARKFDPYACIIQLFVMLALLPLAGMLADTIMQNAFSERRHYREYKTETTPDFSDVRAKVEQLDQQTKSAQEKLMNYGEAEP